MEEQKAEQAALAERVVLEDRVGDVKKAAGLDSAYFGNKVISGAVLMQYGQVFEEVYVMRDMVFAYRPTFLMFTEGPSIVEATRKLSTKPDLLFVDGHGIAHPRRAGLASYVGVLTGIPTIGVAKKFLVGEYNEPQRERKGEPLMEKGEQIGWVVRPSHENASIFISPGSGVSIETSLELTLKFLIDKKLPEPLALAHEYVGKVRSRVQAEAQRAQMREGYLW